MKMKATMSKCKCGRPVAILTPKGETKPTVSACHGCDPK